jgi:hypothetical protein
VIEKTEGEWFAVVAYVENDWDFINGHQVFGPHVTKEAVENEMFNNVSNPGGYNVVYHDMVTKRTRELIETGYKFQSRRPW